MADALVESERESPKRRALHTLLKGLAFVPNLVLAAVVGSLLAAPISLLFFRIFPSHIAAYIQDVTTLLPAFGLGYLVARKFHHSVARWIWVPAIVLWMLVVLPDVAGYTGQNCEPFAIAVLPARIRIRHPHELRRRISLAFVHSADTLLYRLFAGSEVRGAPQTNIEPR